jgi:acyl-CoA thioester hydrolase
MNQPEVFNHPFRVTPDDIDEMGHMNNVVYLRYAQDAAVAHWLATATREQVDGLVWVARRHEIEYLRPAFKDDELIARTWVGEASGATYERFVEIRRAADDEVLAKVRSVWALLDAKTLRPKRVTPELRLRFEPEPSPPDPTS